MTSDIDELTKRGILVLVRELGQAGAYRFLQAVHNHRPEDFLSGPPEADPSSTLSPAPGTPVASTDPLAVASRSPLLGRAEFQLPLFQPDVQPWSAPRPADTPNQYNEARQALLAQLANSELGGIEQKVANVLQRFPETRDSDTALAIRYWSRFQADILEQWPNTDLDALYVLQSIDTISRTRRHVQHDLKLFQGRPRTQTLRAEMQREFHQYMVDARADDPEIRLYLDETGNEPGGRLTAVAGVCVLDWRQYEKYHAALRQIREGFQYASTLRFADLDGQSTPVALKLLSELKRRRGGLLFIAHTIPSRGRTHPYLVDLFIQLTIDSVRHMAEHGCVAIAKGVTVMKEADSGFDAVYLQPLELELARQLAREFPDRVYLRGIQALPKGSDVLLECADLVAGGFQRRILFGGRNPKDKFAEAVMNVTGFEEPRDPGVVVRMHAR